ADNRSILGIVMVEGVFMGFLSWVLGALLAVPISQFMSRAVGLAFMDAPLSYVFSTSGLTQWLGLVLALSALASFLPAWNASRLTIREVLAYE
ncbi:MAG: FtsX-like permease family protein, partial [Chloroflexota bacterium]